MRSEPERLCAFSDGVFAIALTLLVLELHVPAPRDGESVAAATLHDWPALVAFLVSFAFVGLFWIHHHHMLGLLKATDHRLLQVNLLLLLTVVLMPYFTEFLGAYLADSADRSSVVVYGAGMALSCTAWCATWWYVTGHAELHARPLSKGFVRASRWIYGVGPVGYGVATALATLSATAAIVVFLGLPLGYYLPRGLPGEADGPWAWAGLRTA